MCTSLSKHDLAILSRIKDPESSTSSPLLVDDTLPGDPHLADPAEYHAVVQRERAILLQIQQAEQDTVAAPPSDAPSPLDTYLIALASLTALVAENPSYASARNNRAQALRRIYGDAMLIQGGSATNGSDIVPGLKETASEENLVSAVAQTLGDLDAAIALLTPRTPFAPLSPQAAQTLAQAYTQRGALYHASAKRLAATPGAGPPHSRIADRRESRWERLEFEENASRDFMSGGRYGNEVARNLAVSTNPTAKLCGEMVKEAMRREYGL